MSFAKDIIQWNYGRGTWQYDVFCLLIIAFIFLTPKIWFDKRERLATQTARLIVKKEDFSPEKGALEKKVRELSGNENAEIIEWHERRNEQGEIFYEIDIR
ncbi:MAG TPA: hypothetical protein VGB68_13410 [Pyrinomonadaceae bacterium]|jgi:hypothetical protein